MDEMERRRLHELVSKLGLPEVHQDWGIEHADPRRLAEFMAFYERECYRWRDRYYVYELILASANDGLVDGGISEDDLEGFRTFLKQHYRDVWMQFRYWLGLADMAEFPVSRVISDIAGEWSDGSGAIPRQSEPRGTPSSPRCPSSLDERSDGAELATDKHQRGRQEDQELMAGMGERTGTVADILSSIDHCSPSHWLYLPDGEPWYPWSRAAVLDSVVTPPGQEGRFEFGILEAARHHRLMQALPISKVQDVVRNARTQRSDADSGILFEALLFYYDNGRYMLLG